MPTDYERYLEAQKRMDTLRPRALTGIEPAISETTGVDIPSLMSPSAPEARFLSDVVFSSEGSAKDLPQAFKRVAGGTLRGLTLGAVDVFPEEKGSTSSGVSEFIGTIAPWSLAGKIIGAIPLVAKLGRAAPIIGSAVRGGLAGATVGAAEQGIGAARGHGFDVETVGESAVTFAALDGALTALGKFGQFLLKTRQAKRFAAELDAAVKDGRLPEMTEKEVEGIKKAAMVGDGMPRPIPITESNLSSLKPGVKISRTTKEAAQKAKEPWEMTREEFVAQRPEVSGYQYHGSPHGDIGDVDVYRSRTNPEGSGFYATTSREQASTYAKGRTARGEAKGKAEESGRVNYVKSNARNMLDMEQMADKKMWAEIANDLDVTPPSGSIVASGKPFTNMEAYRELMYNLRDDLDIRSGAEAADMINERLVKRGIDATTHIEGKRSGKPHDVFVYIGEDAASIVTPESVHRAAIIDAIKNGKSIPDDVISAYPDLAKKYKGAVKPQGAVGKKVDGVKSQPDIGGFARTPKDEAGDILIGSNVLKPRLIERSGKAINLSIENPVYTFDRLGKPMKDTFYEPARDAEHVANVRIKAIKDATDRMAKALGLSRKQSQRIHAYAYSQQEGGTQLLSRAKIEVPTTVGMDGVPRPGLNKNEREAYDWMRQQFDKRFTEINEARKIAGVEPLPKVENYFTFSRANEFLARDGHTLMSVTPSAFDQAMRQADQVIFQYEKRGFFGKKKIGLDALNLFKRYNESAIRHTELTPVVARNRELLSQRINIDGKDMPFSEVNPEAYKFINQWNNHIAGMRATVFSPQVERGAEILNRNIAFATLSFSFRSMAIQPVAINNTVAMIGPRWVLAGAEKMLRGGRVDAMAKSRVLLGREFDATVMDAFGVGAKIGTAKQKIGEAGMAGLKALDMVTAQTSWLGAYEKATKVLKMSERNAIRYADDIVVKTQASASPIDMSPIQRTALGRTATLFQTFSINEFNLLRRELAGIDNKQVSKKEAAKRLARWIAGINVVNVIYEDVLHMNSPYPAPINAAMQASEKGDSPTRAYLLEMAGLIPILGGLKYGGSPLGATISTIEDARDVVSGKASGRKTAQTAGKILGVPGTMQISKLSKLIEEQQ